VVVSTDEAAKVASTNQFFNLALECFAFLCGVVVLRCGGMRSACRASLRRRDRGTFRGAYLVKRGCQSSLGLGSGRERCVGGVLAEGV